ncbi:SDR family NAD(P)-dependent oxidoreductase [Sphingomonas sp. MG17]|uniref:SDR family NAD(P)-dependent oxidoreductase n=1 Tax=Sphingomonas tagetis TaxID=2949092 RepID=A0A9X2HRG3_9SPHN|nr:SDR family NAD(P)-dependent oxidoreductase [Sphingomonas tagetis]
MKQFDGQVVVISGAGRGIGRQHALYFAEQGASVVVNDYGGNLRGENANNPTPANEVVEQIRATGGTALASVCDIADPVAVRQMIDEAVGQFGRIDVMVHNASSFAPLGAFEEATQPDLARLMGVNLNGGWNLAQACWPYMRAQQYGRVVMTGSAAGYFGRASDQAYSVAKGALMPLVKILADEGAAHGIKANMMAPVAATENAIAQKFPLSLADYAPPIQITTVVAALCHRDCPVSGRMFHTGGGYVGEVFVAETEGRMFRRDEMTVDAVLSGMPAICDRSSFIVPEKTDDSARKLLGSLMTAYPELAKSVTNG